VAEVLLFHSVLGLRPAVTDFAGQVRAAGHAVHAPDLWDGALFDDYAPGIEKLDALGDDLTARAAAELARLDDRPVVLAGFSAGAWLAQHLAGGHAAARGAVLMHDAQTPAGVELESWPGAVPIQVHASSGDLWFDWDAARELERIATAAGAAVEIHSYPGSGHVFGDPGMPGYDAASAALMLERVLGFLARAG
jgi:dienelactone hydrolase